MNFHVVVFNFFYIVVGESMKEAIKVYNEFEVGGYWLICIFHY